MASIVQIKRSSGSNAANTSILAEGELAYSQDRTGNGANAILYIESVDSGANPVIHKVGGKYYTDIVDKVVPASFNQANVAFAQANVSFSQANVAINQANVNFTESNSKITVAFNQANVSFAQANVAFNAANTATTYATSAFAQANVANDLATKAIANVLAGTGITVTGYGATQPNVTVNLANTNVTSGSYGGTTNGVAIIVDAQGRITSAANTTVSSVLSIAGNSGTDTVTVGIDTLTFTGTGGGISTSVTDNVISFVNTGVKTVTAGAGLSTDLASGNITLVNTGVTSLSSAGHGIVFDVATGNTTATFTGVGKITGTASEVDVSGDGTGNVTIGLPNDVSIANDLTVTGNLYVLGDAVSINTSTITIEDPLVKFGNVTNPSDSLSIGFYGQYTSSGAKYAGLYRDHADNGVFKLFKDLATDPTTNVVAEANFTLATLKANLTGGNITSLVNAIAVDSGGTGRKTLTANAVLYGDGTNAVALATGSAGQVLQLTDAGMVAFGSIDGGTY